MQLGEFSEEVVRARAKAQYEQGRARTEVEVGAPRS